MFIGDKGFSNEICREKCNTNPYDQHTISRKLTPPPSKKGSKPAQTVSICARSTVQLSSNFDPVKFKYLISITLPRYRIHEMQIMYLYVVLISNLARATNCNKCFCSAPYKSKPVKGLVITNPYSQQHNEITARIHRRNLVCTK
jgi:hypothetical protein